MMKLNKDIFTRPAISNAIRAYGQLADIRVDEDPDYWILKFDHCQYDRKRTECEFENYLIGLENG